MQAVNLIEEKMWFFSVDQFERKLSHIQNMEWMLDKQANNRIWAFFTHKFRNYRPIDFFFRIGFDNVKQISDNKGEKKTFYMSESQLRPSLHAFERCIKGNTS